MILLLAAALLAMASPQIQPPESVPPQPPPTSTQSAPPQYFLPALDAYLTADRKKMPKGAGAEGDVILLVKFSEDGVVVGCWRLVGEPTLANDAIHVVATWKFRPISEKGQRVPVITYVGFHNLADGTVHNSFPFGVWKENQSMPKKLSGLGVKLRGTGGKLVRRVNPSYPASAKEKRLQGSVKLRVIINKEGHISLIEITSASSVELALAAIDAVRQWEYEPYIEQGEAVEIETSITVNFTLEG